MKSIPTIFDGVFYRSRLEARWAATFAKLRLAADYELEGFEFDVDSIQIRYLPDFYVRRWDLWLEIKPISPTRTQWAMQRAFLEHKSAAFVCGSPRYRPSSNRFDYSIWSWDSKQNIPAEYLLATCGRCGGVAIAPAEWRGPAGAKSTMHPLAADCACIGQRFARFHDGRIVSACFFANSHRFGERAPMAMV